MYTHPKKRHKRTTRVALKNTAREELCWEGKHDVARTSVRVAFAAHLKDRASVSTTTTSEGRYP